MVLDEELAEALGCEAYVRSEGRLTFYVAFGQIRFHKINGYRQVASLLRLEETNAA